MCGLALFFTKKKERTVHILITHQTTKHRYVELACMMYKGETWDRVRRFTSHRSELWNTFWHTRGRSVRSTREFWAGICEVRAIHAKKDNVYYYIYIYISLNWKFRWARNTSNVRNASSAHPFIGFSNLICLWANSTTTNRCSSMIAVKPTNDGESAPCQITRRKETSCQGRSTLYILGINSSHL